MKKVLVCALAALFLMASCLTAIAAAPTYDTTTTYDLTAGAEKVTIKSTLKNTAAVTGNMVTFLAHVSSDDDIADSEIRFIDQKTVESDPVSFEYTVAKSEYAAVVAKSGSNASDVNAPTVIDVDANDRTFTVKVMNGSTEIESKSVTVGSAQTVGTIATGVTVASTYKIDSVKVGSNDITYTAPNGAITLTDSTNIVKGSEVIVAVSPNGTAPVIKTDKGSYGWGIDDGDGKERLIVFGQVEGLPEITADNYTKACGAKIGIKGKTLTAYAAYAATEEGLFAIQLEDTATGYQILGNTWTAKIYAENTYGSVESAEFDIVVPAAK